MKTCRFISSVIVFATVLWFSATAAAHPQWGVAADRRGQIYFSDIKNVWKVAADGSVSIFRKGGDWHTHDINVDENDNLYGADNSYDPTTKKFYGGIWKMTPGGAFSWIVPMAETLPTGTGIWKDARGNTYHVISTPGSPPTLVSRSISGKLTVLSGSERTARSYRQSSPYSGGMAFGRDGTLFFTVGSAVFKASPAGTIQNLTGDIPKAGGTATMLLGLAVDDQSNIFVADWGNRRVLKIMANGQQTSVLNCDGTWYPTGVALREKDLYSLEESHSSDSKPLGTRLRKLAADGTVTILAEVDGAGKIVQKQVAERIEMPQPPVGDVHPEEVTTSSSQRSLLLLVIPVAVAAFIVWRRRKILSRGQTLYD